MKKIIITTTLLLTIAFAAFSQDITNAYIKSDEGAFFTVVIKDYSNGVSTVTVNGVTATIDESKEFGESVLLICRDGGESVTFEFDSSTNRFRFYSENKLILSGTILKVY
tara:strand:- start:279 stop:608 length:330 start_codon:yes stop_codon:yes gene_type:complete